MLQDGWGPDTPEHDSLLRRYVLGWARFLEDTGYALGDPCARDDDLAMLDTDHPVIFGRPTIVLRPLRDDEWQAVLARTRAFYTPETQGPFWMISPWPAPDLSGEGAQLLGHPPFMLRSAAGPEEPPSDPPGLDVVEVADVTTLRDFERALVTGFGIGGLDPDVPSHYSRPGWLDVPDWRMWVGYLDGEPVATAAVHVSHGLNRVESIATLESARGRGIGAALTWRATLADPDSPAALIASDHGRSVYERMGYLPLFRFTNWSVARR